MKYVFVNGRLAIIVRYWEQQEAAVDGGARVELRRVEPVEGEHHRAGAAGFTVRPVADGGLWRADLFMVLSDPGTSCFHFHPRVRDGDVGERHLDDALTADPRGWIAGQLGDLDTLLHGCGGADLLPSIDLDEHRHALPSMLAAVDACLARIPAAMARIPAAMARVPAATG